VTVIAWLLGLILLALVWPKAVRIILGGLVILLCLAIAWGLIVWALVAWGDQTLNGGTYAQATMIIVIVPTWLYFELRDGSHD